MIGITQASEFCVKYLAKPIAAVSEPLMVTMLSMSERLLRLVRSGVADDIARFKNSRLDKVDAETKVALADAQTKLAQAALETNQVNLQKKRRWVEAEIKEREARATVALMDAETRRIQAVGEAQAKLIEAVSKLNQEGGKLMLSEPNLLAILRISSPHVTRTYPHIVQDPPSAETLKLPAP